MKILKVLAVGVAIVGVGVTTTLTASAAEWNARTVDQIKADIAKTSGKEYTIVWGDTLSGISAATNITVEALAQRNSIENVDLIFAGNKLIFEGNVVTVQNNQGETVAQTVIKPEEKVDPTKKVGEAVDTSKDTTKASNTNTGKLTSSDKTDGSKNTDTTTSTTGGSTSDTGSTNTGGSTSNTGSTNTGGSTSNTGNTSTGGSTSNTGNSNTGGSSSNTGNSSTGGSSSNSQTPSTPSEKPETPTEPSKPAEPTIVSGYIGNSGLVFDSGIEANKYGDSVLDTDFSKNGYVMITIFYSDGSEKFSIDWY